MRVRSIALSFLLLLFLVTAGCKNQSSAPASSSDTNSPAAPAAPDNSAAPASSGGNSGAPSNNNMARNEPKAEPAKPMVVPTGTVVTVRLGQSIGSKVSQPGQSFSATVATPVKIDGTVMIPSGANATGTVVDAKPLGRFKGGAVLQVRLDSININGTDRPVQTSSVTRSAQGKGKRTAVLAGGGAGLGALIGGLAGGGKGAAIGALAGGGAGGAGAAFTGNKDIVLPAESALSFRLEQPLELK
jgi:hypothetical protein